MMKTILYFLGRACVLCASILVLHGAENNPDEPSFAVLQIAPLHVHLEERFVRRMTPYAEFIRRDYPEEFAANRRSYAGHLDEGSVSGVGRSLTEEDLNATVAQLVVDQRFPPEKSGRMIANEESLTAEQMFVLRKIDLGVLEKGDPMPVVKKLLKSWPIAEVANAATAGRHASFHVWNSVYQQEDGKFLFVKCVVTLLWGRHGEYYIEHMWIYSGVGKP